MYCFTIAIERKMEDETEAAKDPRVSSAQPHYSQYDFDGKPVKVMHTFNKFINKNYFSYVSLLKRSY